MPRLRNVCAQVSVFAVVFDSADDQLALFDRTNTIGIDLNGQVRQTSDTTRPIFAGSEKRRASYAYLECKHLSLSNVDVSLTRQPAKRPTTRDLLEMDEMRLHRKLFTVQNQ